MYKRNKFKILNSIVKSIIEFLCDDFSTTSLIIGGLIRFIIPCLVSYYTALWVIENPKEAEKIYNLIYNFLFASKVVK